MAELKLIRIGALLNIMDRELYEFSETGDNATIPQRIDDLRALVASMQGIVQTGGEWQHEGAAQ
jgi:hypothetical protein